jgi:hypothetical protein
MKENRITIASFLMAMLILSMVFVPAVSARATSQNEGDHIATIDTSTVKSISEEEMEKISKNVKTLKETETEKIVSFTKDDGSVGYAVSWKDKDNPDKIYFTFVDQNELVASNALTTSNLNDEIAVADAIAAARSSFWHGSYVEQYGSSVTGGIYIHFSETDAEYITDVGSVAAGALAAVLGSIISPLAAAILGPLVTIAVQTLYWSEQNSDGSLDIKVPFANIATMLLTKHVYMKIGSHWYTI